MKTLPEGYYVSHFNELIAEVETLHGDRLADQDQDLILKYQKLSLNAQKLFVRIANNRDFIFSHSFLQKYSKDCDVESAIKELFEHELAFLCLSDSEGKERVLKTFESFFDVDYVQASHGLNVIYINDVTQSKNKKSLNLTLDDANLYLFLFKLNVQFFEYLYFGNAQENIKLMALRDLKDLKSIRAKSPMNLTVYDWHLALMRKILRSSATSIEANTIDQFLKAFSDLNDKAHIEGIEKVLKVLWNLKDDELKIKLAPLLIQFHVLELFIPACKFLKRSKSEQLIDYAKKMVEKSQSHQTNDYIHNHFLKSKAKYVVDENAFQKNAETMSFQHGLSHQPEKTLRDHLQQQGIRTFYVENRLWNLLFGVFFWDVIFGPKESAFYRHQSLDKTFYKKNKSAVDDLLNSMPDNQELEKFVLRKFTKMFGKKQFLFQWNGLYLEAILQLIKHSPEGALSQLLLRMAQDFKSYSSSFPDLMSVEPQKITFIEVKAEGDKLSTKQFNRLQELTQLGYQGKVVNLKWQQDPQQIYTVVDLETTGGVSGRTGITEFAGVKVQNGKVIDSFQTLINPKMKIPPFITRITGINDAMVANAPVFSQVADQIRKFMEGTIFVAHNVNFDYGFLQKEFRALDEEFVQHKVCTVALSRKRFKGLESYSLKNLTQHFSIPLVSHHRAFCDALAASEILVRCLDYDKLDKSYLEENQQSVVVYDYEERPQLEFDL